MTKMEINAQVSKLQMWLLKTEEANLLLSSQHVSSNYHEQHSLTHHFFLISRFLFLLTKKGTFSSNQVTSKKEISPWLNTFFKQYCSEIWEVVYALVCVHVCMCRCGWMSMLVHIWRPSALFSWDRDRASHWTWSEAGEQSWQSPVPTPHSNGVREHAAIFDFLHECWRFELKFSGLYSMWSFLPSHLQPQMFIYLTNVHVINE